MKTDENGSDYWQLVGLRQSNCTALPQQWLECRCDDASASRRPLQRKFEQFACNCARRDRCGECSGGRQRSARCVRWRRRPRQQCRLWSVLAARNDLGRVDPPLVSNQYAWHHRDGPVNRAAHAPAWLGHDCQRHVQCRIQSRASRFRVCCDQNRSRGLLGSALPRACAVWHPCKIGRAWLRTGHQVPSKHDGQLVRPWRAARRPAAKPTRFPTKLRRVSAMWKTSPWPTNWRFSANQAALSCSTSLATLLRTTTAWLQSNAVGRVPGSRSAARPSCSWRTSEMVTSTRPFQI